MALTSKVLSSIQRAGQAVHDAQQLVNAALESQAARVAAAMTQKVAVTESETLFKDWKALTELEGEFSAVDARLRDIFAAASKVGSDAVAVVPSTTAEAPGKAKKSPKQNAAPGQKGRKAKQAAVAEEASVAKAHVKRAKKAAKAPEAQADGEAAAAVEKSPKQKRAPAADKAPRIKNDVKALAALETVLNRDSFTPIKLAQIALDASIPMGSINAAVRKLTDQKLIIESEEKGSYKLA